MLAARQAGIRGFALVLLHEDASTPVEIGLASPARDAERLAQLLRERLGNLVLAQPVEAMRLEAGDFVPLPGRSGGMFGDAAGEAEDWARLLERLRARLGHDAVCGLATSPITAPSMPGGASSPASGIRANCRRRGRGRRGCSRRRS